MNLVTVDTFPAHIYIREFFILQNGLLHLLSNSSLEGQYLDKFTQVTYFPWKDDLDDSICFFFGFPY